MLLFNYLFYPFCTAILTGIFTGLISPIVILRKAEFTSHILGHTSMTGHLLGSMLGFNPIISQCIVNMFVSIIISLRAIKEQDLHIGVLSNVFLGLGIFLLYQYQKGYAGSGMGVFYGSILTISQNQIIALLLMGILFLIFFIKYIRWYLFYLLEPSLSEIYLKANSKFIDICFHIVLAIVVTMSCQVIGALLVFTLLVGPGAIAMQWFGEFKKIFLLSVIVSTSSILISLFISCYLWDVPVSFCTTLIISALYLIGYFKDLKRSK